ncbi:MAG: NAD(P)/FAD-dependent oxidoreductase [Gemmatimonadetes bacterium]|nr:NAD(P)/FAD-dependent oxidoreductase [Gemmatimonadota bacterium]
MRAVIIGNGVAGMEAALAIRQREPDWEISIVSEESDHPFSRTALMYVFCGQLSHRDIETYERDLYERLGFARVRARATGVDVDNRQVQLAGGLEPLPWDRLLIACGSRPRPGPWPNSGLDGIGHFVTMQDLEWLEREVHGGPGEGRPPRPEHHLEATAGDSPYRPRPAAAERRGRRARSAAVIGGGLVGIEAAEILAHAGVDTHFLIMEDWYWPLAIDGREAAWIARVMEENGLHVHLNTVVDEFVGDAAGAVTGMRTRVAGPGHRPNAFPDETWAAGPEIECDIAVVTIGVMPNTGWLDGSRIELDERSRGIVVDAGLGASAPGVYAAGDCAAVAWFDGSRRPEQLWYTSRAQGRIAGAAMLGDTVVYERGTFYNSAKFMDVEYTTAGLVNFNLEGEKNWFHEETGPVRSTTRIVLQNDRVVGFNMLGRRWDHTFLVRWIEERRDLSYVLSHLREALYDPELTPPPVFDTARATVT